MATVETFGAAAAYALALAVVLPNLTTALLADDWSLVLAGKHMLTEDFFRPFYGPWLWPEVAEGWKHYHYYRPVTLVTFALDYGMWGFNPFGYHLTSAVIHGCCTLLMFTVARRLAPRRPAVPILSAVLFALHPVHEYTVLWISGRSDLLCALFYLAAVWFFLVALDSGRRSVALAVSAAAALALASKEMAYSLPLICAFIFLLRRPPQSPYKAWALQAVALVGPVAGVTAAFLLLRLVLFGPAHTFFELESTTAQKFQTLWMSVRHLTLPFHISFKTLLSEYPVAMAACAVVIAGLATPILHNVARRPVLLGGGWAALAVLPVIHLFMPWYMYIPSAGFCLALGAVLGFARGRWAKAAAVLLAACLLSAYTAQWVSRSKAWRQAGQVADTVAADFRRLHTDPSTRPRFLVVPGAVDDVPVYTHNLPAHLRMESDNPELDPVVLSYAAFPRSEGAHRVEIETLSDNVLRLRLLHPEARFVFPHYRPGNDAPPWGTVKIEGYNAEGLPNVVRLALNRDWLTRAPVYVYRQGRLQPWEENRRDGAL